MRASRHAAAAIGFMAALMLTGAAFALVQLRLFSRSFTLQLIGALAVLQFLVHCRYFLHLQFKGEGKERGIALAFAGLVGLIMALGTLGIMADLKHRMM